MVVAGRSKGIFSAALTFGLSLGLCAAFSTAASAKSTFRTIYSFCTLNDCDDGSNPTSKLLIDASGAMYGTAEYEGGNGAGTVFEMKPKGRGWTYSVIYNFCTATSCMDGTQPLGNLIEDTSGDLYGTTYSGGKYGDGTVFELVPSHGTWKEKILYSFCAKGDCFDGERSVAGLTYVGAATGARYDGVSPLFGTTEYGGSHDDGVVFELILAKNKWSEKPIYNFCDKNACTDGNTPLAALTTDAAGNLYGTTEYGGDHGYGLVFELSKNAKDKWTETNIYSFCSENSCSDGENPYADVLMDGSGDLFGTTNYGGSFDRGVLFKLEQKGKVWKESVLYSFCVKSDCTDGAYPRGGLTLDPSGNLFGTTYNGGTHNDGSLFEFSKSDHVLHNFCTNSECSDGENPRAGLSMDAAGDLFGTTNYGGAHGDGSVFEFTP